MHTRLSELVEYAARARASLLAAVASTTLEERSRRTAEDRWSIDEILEHLHLVESGVARLVAKGIARAREAGLGPELETGSLLGVLDAHDVRTSRRRLEAPEIVRPRSREGGGGAARDALEALGASRAALIDAYGAGDGLDLTRVTAPHQVLGELDLYQWLLFIAHHEERHTRQIVATVSELRGTGRPRVKICCIASVEEAWVAIRHGASALGLVSAMPSGPGVIEEDAIREITAVVPPGIATFLLTSLTNVEAIVAQQRRTGANTVQLCDRLTRGMLRELREALPGIALVQVVHVRDERALEEATRAAADGAHAVLLDSGNPSLAVKELGGTGRTHDWEISRRIRDAVGIPVYLAGGLNPGNVGEAVRRVAPFGVDVCSGLRTDGRLDELKVAELFAALAAS